MSGMYRGKYACVPVSQVCVSLVRDAAVLEGVTISPFVFAQTGGRFEERPREDQRERVCRGSPQQAVGQGDRAGTGESLQLHIAHDRYIRILFLLDMMAAGASLLCLLRKVTQSCG